MPLSHETSGLVLDLPRDVPFGIYRVIVFRDDNNNSYEAGDTILSKDNGKRLLAWRILSFLVIKRDLSN